MISMIRESNILVSIWAYLFLFLKVQNLSICLLFLFPFIYCRLKLLSYLLGDKVLSHSFFIVWHYYHFIKLF
jgi:hypothetical protein